MQRSTDDDAAAYPFFWTIEFRCPIHGHPETLDDRNSFVLEEKEGDSQLIPIKNEESSITKEHMRDYIRVYMLFRFH